jgi:acyl-CoA dehydrogenase
MILDFLRPSPHGGIKLSAAMVPAKNVLGQEGQAYEQIMKPFREVEDAVLMGPMVGGMARQLELVAGLIRKQAITPSEEVKSALGRLQFLVDQARILTYEVSLMLDSPGHPEFLSLLLAGRDLGTRFQSDIESLIAICGIKPSADLEHLTKDLVLTGNIAKNVALRKQVKMGEGVLLK